MTFPQNAAKTSLKFATAQVLFPLFDVRKVDEDRNRLPDETPAKEVDAYQATVLDEILTCRQLNGLGVKIVEKLVDQVANLEAMLNPPVDEAADMDTVIEVPEDVPA